MHSDKGPAVISSFRPAPESSRKPHFRRRLAGGAMVLAVILVGCGKKTVTAAAPPASPDQPSAPATPGQTGSAPASTPVTVAAAPDGGADLRALNHVYIGWIIQSHQRPKTFEAFVAASGVNVPPPPAGKKYVIDHAGFIAIQNQ